MYVSKHTKMNPSVGVHTCGFVNTDYELEHSGIHHCMNGRKMMRQTWPSYTQGFHATCRLYPNYTWSRGHDTGTSYIPVSTSSPSIPPYDHYLYLYTLADIRVARRWAVPSNTLYTDLLSPVGSDSVCP